MWLRGKHVVVEAPAPDLISGAYGGGGGGGGSSGGKKSKGDDDKTAMPEALRRILDGTLAWAEDNCRDARRDRLKFWILKVPAILIAASGSVLTYFNLEQAMVFTGALASVIVAFDGILRPGANRDVHYLAYLELRELHNFVASEWARLTLRDEATNEAAASLIEKIQKETTRISGNLKSVEVSNVPTDAVMHEAIVS